MKLYALYVPFFTTDFLFLFSAGCNLAIIGGSVAAVLIWMGIVYIHWKCRRKGRTLGILFPFMCLLYDVQKCYYHAWLTY